MTNEDPFGLDDNAGRTRVRPRRTGDARPSAAPDIARTAPLKAARASDNPMVRAFAALLGIAPELQRAVAPDNPDVLRTRLQDNLTHARDAAVSMGVPLTRADQGAWFVGALLDDVAINTPWGGSSGWPRQPIVAAMYGNVDSGERFFDLAEELLRYPERDPQLLELVFLCLSLGFRGKHRIGAAAGEAEIAGLRAQMARVMHDRDAADAPLSPNWQGVAAEDEERRFIVPIWSLGLMAIALITAIYVGLSVRLSDRGEDLFTLAGVLPPPERTAIFRPVIETVEQPQMVANPLLFELLPLFAEAAPENTAGALTGREDVSIAVVVVQASDPEVFRSAKADINDIYGPLVGSVAAVIKDNAELIGSVRVVGHTDSIPVQTSNPFHSNQGLSEARAKTIADMLVAAGVPAGLVASEGKAATEPIADNGTREGRARNRRVEIILQKKV
ncbi:type IVB secretion system protein IcmH/DotU [Paracoccus marinaquae]|uniref:Type IVB secretion system protein IcmH/DotU n=1 Tax=Paracoccus marinaquae TaxID=2841926 RepID=A0ABS6ALN7_9RHOB|nr:type IVB secretion system protein IcmH/DotU [Paracoccus marinaquae]MBU3031508.1 type IVB secretion system protein IcmH/DotU [Paracoccus marinaquae]